jgi:uncharacterized protein
MPPTLTYPGVYIEELSSGVHTITGVATSIAAFIGWANQGPTDEAVLVESWQDFQVQYAGTGNGIPGLTSYNGVPNYLGYAVNQFFGNGGQQAYIVRLAWDGSLPSAPGTNLTPCATAVATGVGFATTQITATVGSVSGSIQIDVGTAVLQSITITPAVLPPIPLGSTLTFSAAGNYSDGTTQAPPGLTWASANTGVISFGLGGSATAVGPGTAVLTATSGLVSATITVTVTQAALLTVAVTPSSVSLAQGQTQQLRATGSYSNGTTYDLTAIATWTPTTPATANVSDDGLVTTGTSTGTAPITASWAGVTSANVSVTVVGATLTGITLQPAGTTLVVATTPQNVTFTALAIESNTSSTNPPQPLTGGTWSSSNPLVATIADGVATAVAQGSTIITVTSGAVSASATLVVTTATLTSISITPVNASVAVGQTLQLSALGFYSDGTTVDLTQSMAWSSGEKTQATVAPITGLVTGVTVPTSSSPVKIEATWQGQPYSTSVTVTPAVLQSITVFVAGTTPPPVGSTAAPIAVLSGQTLQLTANGIYSTPPSQPLTPQPLTSVQWSSATPAIASVNPSTGLVTAVAPGGSLTLFASNPGAWGNTLRVAVTPQTSNNALFSLLVQQLATNGRLTTLESYTNLSVSPTSPQYVVTVIQNDSQYISFTGPGMTNPAVPIAAPSATPLNSPIALSGGADGSVLIPASDQNFELALGPDASLTSTNDFGLRLLDRVDIFNLLCVPGETDARTIAILQEYCWNVRAFYIVDCPQTATFAGLNNTGPVGTNDSGGLLVGQYSTNAAYYFPWVQAPDPLFGNRPTLFPPCGFVAGIYASTDSSRGVWKAPAGIDASLTGQTGLQYNLTDQENGGLNIQAINCLRQFKVYGDVVWGARTLQGNDQAGSQWKYVPIRRLALFLESSLYDGTQWVVFEPNDEPLWGQIRLNVGSFMQGQFLQGAFQGTTPQQAYFVKCDSENNPQSSIDLGVVNILVGFAPLYPAEFVVIQIQQMAGQLQS